MISHPLRAISRLITLWWRPKSVAICLADNPWLHPCWIVRRSSNDSWTPRPTFTRSSAWSAGALPACVFIGAGTESTLLCAGGFTVQASGVLAGCTPSRFPPAFSWRACCTQRYTELVDMPYASATRFTGSPSNTRATASSFCCGVMRGFFCSSVSTPTFANLGYNTPGDVPNVAATSGTDIPDITNATASPISWSRARANAIFGESAPACLTHS